MNLETLPGEFGFQFTYRPHSPWFEIQKNDGASFQLMSVGGMLLTQINREHSDRTSLTLAFTLGFFEDAIVFGLGFDLYRGVALSGDHTAPTGLFGWAMSGRGQVTPENVSLVVGVNLAAFTSRLSGTGSN